MEFSLDSSTLFIHFLYLLLIQVLSHVCPSLSHVHQSFLMFLLMSLVSSYQLILSINFSHVVIVASTYDSTPSFRIFVSKISYNLSYGSPILSISSSSSHSFILAPLISSSSSSLSILSSSICSNFFSAVPNILH